MRYLPLLLFIVIVCGALNAGDAVSPASSEGLFVAVGYGGFRGWSADGQNWTAERWAEKSEHDDNIICSLAYREGIFLASGGGGGRGFILRSRDGKHWDEAVKAVKNRNCISNVFTLPDRFFSVFDGHFQTSSDGLKWEALAESNSTAEKVSAGFYRRWAAGKGMVVFGGDYGMGDGKPRIGWIGSTKNGTTRITVMKVSADVVGLVFGNDRFVACTKDGNILTSTDGIEFKQATTTGDQHDDTCLHFADCIFYLRGRASAKTSPDGEHWTPLAKYPRFARATAPNGVAIDCGWGGIAVAADGKTYQKATVPVNQVGITAAVYGVPQTSAK